MNTAALGSLASPEVARSLADVMAETAQALNAAQSTQEVLDRLVRAACTAVPGVDFAGVSISRRRGIETVAASDPLVEEADAAQYELGEGPCLDAMANQTSKVANDLRTDTRWPRFAPRAVGLGLLSQMGTEIFRERSSVGGLNLYSSRADAFDETTQHAVRLFVVHAAIAMDKAVTVSDLSRALQTRQTIGQAVGITMQRYTLTEHLAFNYLVRVSQDSNVPLRDVAQTIVDQFPG